MVNFARNRHQHIFYVMGRFFDFNHDDMFTVRVVGGDAVIGTIQARSATYFTHLTIPVEPIVPRFMRFEHWILNGVRHYEPRVYVTVNDAAMGVVSLVMILSEDMPDLVFSHTNIAPMGNGVILHNPHEEAVRVSGLFLSDDVNNLQRWQIPVANIPALGYLELAGRDSRAAGDLFRVRMGFNVRANRVLFLSDSDGNILDFIIVAPE